MTDCPYCGYQMVRSFRNHQTVSFCRHCWQEMPEMPIQNADSLLKGRSLEQMVQTAIAQKQPAPQRYPMTPWPCSNSFTQQRSKS